MTETFAGQVGDWAEAVKGAHEAIFRESVQRLVSELNALVPVGETAFLRSSLQASTSAMPELLRNNPGAPDPDFVAAIELVIADTELGETIYIGYTANYGAFVHYGTSRMAGRPWVTMAAQRWPQIVAEVEAETLSRLGL